MSTGSSLSLNVTNLQYVSPQFYNYLTIELLQFSLGVANWLVKISSPESASKEAKRS